MTRNEQDAEIGRVVREHGEARRLLACLETKAEATAKVLHTLADELTRNEKRGTVTSAEYGFIITDPVQGPRELHIPEPKEITDLIEDLHETVKKVQKLKDQRTSFEID